jgi:hypothetical protein
MHAGIFLYLWRRNDLALAPAEEPIRDSGTQHFPVSVSWEPPFTMMVDLVGSGDEQSGSDVSAVISNWGTWQVGQLGAC